MNDRATEQANDRATDARLNADGTDQDDWDDHWDKYGEAAKGNPANDYRHAMVLKLLGPLPEGAVVLDIGSGQGQFAVDLQAANPQASVFGVEYSAEGVRRGARRSPSGTACRRTFYERNLLEPVARDPQQPPATHAVCSEVLEHVDDPVALMRNAATLLAPGREGRRDRPGRPAVGVRQAHRALPALHRPGRCTRCSPRPASTSTGCCAPASRSSTSTSSRSSRAGEKLVDDMQNRTPGTEAVRPREGGHRLLHPDVPAQPRRRAARLAARRRRPRPARPLGR